MEDEPQHYCYGQFVAASKNLDMMNIMFDLKSHQIPNQNWHYAYEQASFYLVTLKLVLV